MALAQGTINFGLVPGAKLYSPLVVGLIPGIHWRLLKFCLEGQILDRSKAKAIKP